MSDYYLNLFRPYHGGGRDEISVTRAFIIACAKSKHGQKIFESAFSRAVETSAYKSILANVREENLKWELEAPAESIRERSALVKHRCLLCITPTREMTDSPWGNLMEDTISPDLKKEIRDIVCMTGEPNLKALEHCLCKLYPELTARLEQMGEDERVALLQQAYWDVWRWLYAGARPDAVIEGSNLICLVESKIWGSVLEAQARNHAIKAFGQSDVPILHTTWQEIHDISLDIAKATKDSIINDFAVYLSEFPQLVRWNGFDKEDLDGFSMRAERMTEDEVVLNRLDNHYYQCMEDLCRKYNYEIKMRRGDDWDFTPSEFIMIGNTGIGHWQTSRLSVKWCVGYRAWEMDSLLELGDIVKRGENACKTMVKNIYEQGLYGTQLSFRAVQRFCFINAQDGTWEWDDGSSFAFDSNIGLDEAADFVERNWQKEMEWLNEFKSRRGLEVDASEALRIKKDIISRKSSDEIDIDEIVMATRHSQWNLYPALDVFLHLTPDIFFKAKDGLPLSKDEQLAKLDNAVRIVAAFGQELSKGSRNT